jgi:aryl-alcohol dehydrogenase-like predicted oxidoreductase
MRQRKIGVRSVGAIGLGCMNLSHAYGRSPEKDDAVRLLHRAFDVGVRHFDTAALYGFGSNEKLVGEALKDRRNDIYLASKCGMMGVDGKRVIDGRPETLLKTVDEALRRLQTDHIDLYYLHRWDKSVPIEDSVGTLSRMIEQGKVGALGLSEVSADTLRKAQAVHPVAALQTEYSLWTRNPEISVLEACCELDVAFVAFSPLGRGYLCDGGPDAETLEENDVRRGMPRFQKPNIAENQKVFQPFRQLAEEADCTPGQLALNWLLEQGETIIPIPGTRTIDHLEENMRAAELVIDPLVLCAAGKLINQMSVFGGRYSAATQLEVGTENFPAGNISG